MKFLKQQVYIIIAFFTITAFSQSNDVKIKDRM